MNTNPTADQLTATIERWRTILLELDESTARHKPTPDRWSIAEVVGHMIDSACNNHQRFIRAQADQADQLRQYDQNAWVLGSNYQQSDWKALVSLWHFYNQHLAQVMRNIPQDAMQTVCTVGSSPPCTLKFLVNDYLDHMEHHLKKIEERIPRGNG